MTGPLVDAADAAGRGIERALNRAVLTGKLGFEDLKRIALSVMADIARAAIANGIGAVTVSYTHLDVYKRQMRCRAKSTAASRRR